MFIHKISLLGTFIAIAQLLMSCSDTIEHAEVLSLEEKLQLERVAQGEGIVNANCVVCHSQGINGAPIVGNKKMWAPRLGQGEAVLVEHAINGYELMPAKGGKTHLSDEEIGLAVAYMMHQASQ